MKLVEPYLPIYFSRGGGDYFTANDTTVRNSRNFGLKLICRNVGRGGGGGGVVLTYNEEVVKG